MSAKQMAGGRYQPWTDLHVLASGSLSLPGRGHSHNVNQLLTPTDRMANLLSGVVLTRTRGSGVPQSPQNFFRPASPRNSSALHAIPDRSEMVNVSQLAQP